MITTDLIFSSKPSLRYTRHLLFWTVRFSYLLLAFHSRKYWPTPPAWLTWWSITRVAFIEIAGEIALTYSIVYWLIPVYLDRKKYGTFAAWTLILLAGVFIVTYPNQQLCLYLTRQTSSAFVVWGCLMGYSRFTLSACFIFIAIRMFKAHYRHLQEQETLHQRTAQVEFELLKAQVHPHFLFNTLNNIYSFAMNRSPRAGELLSQLSDMMRYMIYDCEADRMALDREVKMLQDYIGLEQARYGDRLDIKVEIQGDIHHCAVAPLLMIPFVENCFKHGASQVLDRPRVRCYIRAGAGRLDFRLENNKPVSSGLAHTGHAPGTGSQGNDPDPSGGAVAIGGIGLTNIRQRLELLYQGQYELEIASTDDTFSVHLSVPLEETTGSPGPSSTLPVARQRSASSPSNQSILVK